MSTAKEVLVTAERVSVNSLPHALRHGNHADALEEARNLLLFLFKVEVMEEALPEGQNDFTHAEEMALGKQSVIMLILDKVEIGMGIYKFPMLYGSDAPALCERREE